MSKDTLGMECRHCHAIVSKGTILTHLKKCQAASSGPLMDQTTQARLTPYFWLKVEGYPEKQYCLFLQVRQTARLSELDRFLRDIWLECCGHLSQFILDDEYYVSDSVSKSEWEKSMRCMLKSVAGVGSRFIHEYDFGSTTTLKITVVNAITILDRKEEITVLARNVAPEYSCAICGKKAVAICVNCLNEYGRATFLCHGCIGQHDCGDDMILPVVNSPRMGVCGYTGEGSLW